MVTPSKVLPWYLEATARKGVNRKEVLARYMLEDRLMMHCNIFSSLNTFSIMYCQFLVRPSVSRRQSHITITTMLGHARISKISLEMDHKTTILLRSGSLLDGDFLIPSDCSKTA